jgi:type I restriction enzyme R subunit
MPIASTDSELTRKQLRELALYLDRAGFTEAGLATAWRETTNRDIAARIVGYVRQAAIGDPLLPYAERVDRALARLLPQRPRHGKAWTTPQRDWLKRITAGPTCWPGARPSGWSSTSSASKPSTRPPTPRSIA